MSKCVKCGYSVPDEFEWCPKCGTHMSEQPVVEARKVSFAGEIRKCPYCGDFLPSFASKCPSCHNEIRGLSGSNSVNALMDKIQSARTERETIQLIRLFPVPNTKEDILEFMIMASANFDEVDYIRQNGGDGVSNAWLSKAQQCYKKAGLTLQEGPEMQSISDTYADIIKRIKDVQRKKRTPQLRTNATIQFVVAGFFLYIVVFYGSGFLANPRILIDSILMLISGALTLAYIKKENLYLWTLAGYGCNLLYNFVCTFWTKGHVILLLMYVGLAVWFVFGKKTKEPDMRA